jgi:hypothetical protein
MTFSLQTPWDDNRFRVALCFPTSDAALRPYGMSGAMGAIAGLADSGASAVAAQIVDTSGSDAKDIVDRIAALDPPPHVCVGVIRSNIAAALLPWCEAHNITFVATDHSAARFHNGSGMRRYFRVSCVADQLVRTCLHAFSYRNQAARRLLVIVSDYEYGRSIQETTLRLVADHPRWLSVGIVGVMEWPSSVTAAEQREYAQRTLLPSLKAVQPDAVLLGTWGPSIAAFGEVVISDMYALNVPLIIPDAGWDKPAQTIPFPQHSVLGARYYVPPRPAMDPFLASVARTCERVGLSPRLLLEEFRYPVAAAYDAALGIGKTASTLADAGLLESAPGAVPDFFANNFAQAEVQARSTAALYRTNQFERLPNGEQRLRRQDHPVAVARVRAYISDESQWTWFSEQYLRDNFPEAPRRSARSSSGSIVNPAVA